MRVFFGFSICSEALTENVKKTLSLVDGTRKENVRKTSRNRTAREAQKRHFRQTHVSYVKSLPKAIKFDNLGSLVSPDRLGRENVKKTLRTRKENVEGTRKENVAENVKKTLPEENVKKTFTGFV